MTCFCTGACKDGNCSVRNEFTTTMTNTMIDIKETRRAAVAQNIKKTYERLKEKEKELQEANKLAEEKKKEWREIDEKLIEMEKEADELGLTIEYDDGLCRIIKVYYY